MKKVSIITPCYTDLHYLHETIESVQNQSYKNIEHIVINDKSPENFEDIKKQYQNIKNIKFLEMPENGGSAKARNFGIKNSDGDYILVLDSDDMIHKDCIQKMINVVNNRTNYIIYTNQIKFFEDKKNLDQGNIFQHKKYVINDERIKKRKYKSNLFSNSIFFHKNIWTVVGGYDENIRGEEDWHFCLDANLKNVKFQIIPEYLTFYRVRKTNKTLSRKIEDRKKLTEYFISKYKLNETEAQFRRNSVFSIQKNVEKIIDKIKND